MSAHGDSQLRACALGFDSRSLMALQLFFRAKCAGLAVLGGEDDAQVGIIDMDSYNAGNLLKAQRQAFPGRPLILLSLNTEQLESLDRIVTVRKPVQIQSMVAALETARSLVVEVNSQIVETGPIIASIRNTDGKPEAPDIEKRVEQHSEQPIERKTTQAPEPPASNAIPIKLPSSPRLESRTASQAAILLDEKGFEQYIGSLRNIDPDNAVEVRAAQYDPKRYLQGYLQAACKLALEKKCAIRLNTGWKPITIFPQSGEILIEADEQQLRAFCLVPVHSISDLDFATDSKRGVMTISQVGIHKLPERSEGSFDRIESMIWKVALWTSAGRIPDDVDLNRPVILRHWPNFTRLLIFPHAMRIAAVMCDRPRTLLNIAEVLGIKQQYVFAFFSAAKALGLAEQAIVDFQENIVSSTIEPKKNTGLFRKILHRLLRR